MQYNKSVAKLKNPLCDQYLNRSKKEQTALEVENMTKQENELISRTPRLYFDTRVGIEMTMEKEKYPLQKISQLRKLYKELHPEEKLAEFVVIGQLLLPRDGEVYKIMGVIPNSQKLPKVVIVDDFLKITGLESYQTYRV